MMMRSESDVFPVPRRRRRVPAKVASVAGSFAVHAAFAVAAAGIAWHFASSEPLPGRDVVIHFDNPAAAEGDEEASGVKPPAAELRIEARAREASPSPQPVPRARTERNASEADDPAQLPPSMLSAPVGLNFTDPDPVGAAEPGSAAPEPAASRGTAGQGGVRFAGLGASNAQSVVYVVDASGPMVTSMPRVIEELRRSVDQLSTTQRFGVVLFRQTDTDAGAEMFSPVLMRATPSARRRLAEWLQGVTPSGASNPLTGLEAALALKPDALFLLSRSIVRSGGGVWDDGLDATLARLEGLNPPTSADGKRATLIQTIQFLDDDPTGIMQAIGSRHGQGSGYRVVRRGEDIADRAR
jgi:hypothetical protein